MICRFQAAPRGTIGARINVHTPPQAGMPDIKRAIGFPSDNGGKIGQHVVWRGVETISVNGEG